MENSETSEANGEESGSGSRFVTHYNLPGSHWNLFGSHPDAFGSHRNLFGSHRNASVNRQVYDIKYVMNFNPMFRAFLAMFYGGSAVPWRFVAQRFLERDCND